MAKAWVDQEVHSKACIRLGDETATYLEREAHHRDTVVTSVCTTGDGTHYALLRNGVTLFWINRVWQCR